MQLSISYSIRSTMTVFSSTRRTLLTMIGGLSIFRAARSGEEDTFTLVPELAPGQVQRYRQDLKLVRNGMIGHRSRSTVTLEVRERIAGGWLVRWTSSGGELLEADPHVRPMLEVLQALWDGVALDLLLDEGGRVAGLADPAAVRALGETSLDRLAALLSADPARAPMATALRAATTALARRWRFVLASHHRWAPARFRFLGATRCAAYPRATRTPTSAG
jgi:hypothetical protein